MAKYPSMVLTKEGLSMIAESQGGQGLIFTKVAVGAGDLNGGSIINLTQLIDLRINANITAIDATTRPGQVTLTAIVSNSEVESGFHSKEIGVFAKISETGTERLYAYTNAGNYADYMPDKTDPVNEAIFKTTFVVSNAQNIQAVIDKSIVYPTVLEMDKAIEKHDEDTDSHKVIFDTFVKSVTEKDGMVTVTKGDGDKSTFTAFKLDMCYPVGAIYMSTVNKSPEILFGGKWEAMPAGRVLIAQGESEWGTTYSAGSTGGEATHTLSVGELPAHKHNASITNVNIYGTFCAFVQNGHTPTDVISRTDDWLAGIQGGSQSDKREYKYVLNSNHSHNITIDNTGSDIGHNNMQPYIAVYMWLRRS